MKKGGFFFAACSLLLVGLFTIHLSTQRLNARLMGSLPSTTTVEASLAAHVLTITDPASLLRLGDGLARQGSAQLAIIALRRGAQIAPANRDIELALAWCYLTEAQSGKTQTLADARTALAAAARTDPLSPRLAQLQTGYAQIAGSSR